MANKVLPTLGLEGWLNNGASIMERLFFHWLTTNATQSTYFLKELESAPMTLLMSESEEDTKNDIIKSLSNLYQHYFENLEIKVNYKTNSDGVVDYAIDVSGSYNDKGKNEMVTLSKVVQTRDRRLLDLPTLIDMVSFYKVVKTNI